MAKRGIRRAGSLSEKEFDLSFTPRLQPGDTTANRVEEPLKRFAVLSNSDHRAEATV